MKSLDIFWKSINIDITYKDTRKQLKAGTLKIRDGIEVECVASIRHRGIMLSLSIAFLIFFIVCVLSIY